MKLKNQLSILFICLIMGLGVSAQQAGRTITEKENGKTVTIKKGSSFSVLFKKECIGCRYSWEITLNDSAVTKFVKSSYANGPGPGMAGGAQDHRFHFKALKRGRSEIKLVNDDKTFSVTIVVK